MMADRDLGKSKRMVIKVGSALLVEENGRLHRAWLKALCEDIARLVHGGTQVIVVSSGAIALGRVKLGLGRDTLRLEQKQAAAAAGMIELAHAYQDALSEQGISVAQVLLTLQDTESRRRYLNARNTLSALLDVGAVPVINENDTVATDEIRFGDNDRLAARVAEMVSADTLVLLSDVGGLYTADPNVDKNAEWLPEIREITKDVEAMAGAKGSYHGSGGMVTKLAAAKICTNAGCNMVIAKGSIKHPLDAIQKGGRCTWFLTEATPLSARKRWIAGALKPVGEIIIDKGAAKALTSGKSLLPAGVTEVIGDFERGDPVLIKTGAGQELGRGLAGYDAGEARKIMGLKTGEIEKALGYDRREALIHRDDMALH